jgi:hypothetical protein
MRKAARSRASPSSWYDAAHATHARPGEANHDFASGVPSFCRKCSFHLPLTDAQQVEELCRDPAASIGG